MASHHLCTWERLKRQCLPSRASLTFLSGYDCLDAFLELDTLLHCWEILPELLTQSGELMVDVGLPLLHRGILFNARLVFHKKKILYIRCKKSLANDGNFREMRYFTPWLESRGVEEFVLPKEIRLLTGQMRVPIGDLVLEALDCTIAIECCEELFCPDNPSIHLGLQGVDIVCNPSASHCQ